MQRLWPSAKVTTIRKALAAAVPVASLSAVLAWCAAAPPPPPALPHQTPLAQSEESLRRAPAHISEFSPVSAPLALPKCGHIRPPEALLTPDPLLHVHGNLDVRVSFIVGSDGHVHSAFVLDSGGLDEAQIVLRTIRSWRYRPALCNGVPTDSEARVRFSIR